MNMRQITHARVATLCALALAAACTAGYAQETGPSGADAPAAEKPGPSRYESVAIQHVNEAVSVTRELELEPRMKPLLQQAKGLFIIPSYGRAAFGIGGRGGAGVLLVKQADGNWSSPAFYNIGGLNIGLQAGIQGGPMAFILTNEKAINRFRQRNNFSLNAAAGITVLQWTKVAEGSTGSGDAVAWSGAKGIFGDVASIGINDVHFNLRLNQAYYHASQSVAIADILSGKTSNMHADELKQQAAAITGSMSSMGR